jgi:hypothetical protein
MIHISPSRIERLKPNEVFVFGSNRAGYHGKGAAKLAYDRFGAQGGKGEGHFGQSYAIPTKDAHIRTLPLNQIALGVDRFFAYAAENPKLKFLVTEIGCGLAGYTPRDIAPMFKEAELFSNVHVPLSFAAYLRSRQ